MKSYYHTVCYDFTLYKMHYIDTAPQADLPVVLCLHGLTRNSKDYIPLATHLRKEFRFIMPDFLGRGKSDNLLNKKGYVLPYYVECIISLIEKIGAKNLHIIGTSLGGLLAIILAGMKGNKISSIFLNDITHKISRISTIFLLKKLSNLKFHYESYDEILSMTKKLCRTCVSRRETDKLQIIANNMIKKDKNGYRLAWDKNILQLTLWEKIFGVSINLKEFWQQVKCPTFLLWGELSTFVNHDHIEEMRNLANCVIFRDHKIKGAGHAPSLMGEEQTTIIRDWLKSVI